ncbi:sodium/solute symporter [Anaeramoeba flamelloides]|uniref:Sodium/solute symporter n=1 Tax=Anaeramoeba flamelloides TaxID=1746091 RepID=A0ABQ8YR21_9EUKA|nr:sodium/solute symporter [Anaeramoeba flamelloides]
MEVASLNWVDILILVIYFLILFAIGIYCIVKQRGQKKSKEYFLADSNMNWMAVAGSLYSSNIGAEHFLGLAGSASQNGLAIGWFEWIAGFILILLGWFYTPIYKKALILTTPEYLEKRYSKTCKTFLTVISLLLYILTKISATLYSGGVILHLILGWNMYFSIVMLLLATAVYTILGGLMAVVYTEAFQTVLLISGGILTTIFGLVKVGGISQFRNSENIPSNFWHLFHNTDDPELPWPAILCIPFASVFYWCNDQLLVQRVLSARNNYHAKSGCLSAAYLKILPFFILVIPGMIARALFSSEIKDDPNIAFPLLLIKIIPNGLLGFLLSGVISALMSSLASIFNSSSTLITYDIYRTYIRKNAKEKELIIFGKISGIGILLISILWIPFISNISDQLFISINAVANYLAPPITAIFLYGMLWSRVNSRASIYTLSIGCTIGFIRLILEAIFSSKKEFSNSFLNFFIKCNFLYFGFFLFVISSLIIVIVSLLTEPPDQKCLKNTMWKSLKNSHSTKKSPFIDDYKNSIEFQDLILDKDDASELDDFKFISSQSEEGNLENEVDDDKDTNTRTSSDTDTSTDNYHDNVGKEKNSKASIHDNLKKSQKENVIINDSFQVDERKALIKEENDSSDNENENDLNKKKEIKLNYLVVLFTVIMISLYIIFR